MRDRVQSTVPIWRLILSPPASGSRAMAIDETLLELCAEGPENARPVLRLYAFEPACISLGRFQPLSDLDLDACGRRGIEVVRRPSGGRAVLHNRCLTYALVAPADSAPFAGGVRASAVRIGEALAAGLRHLGVAVSLAPAMPRGRRSPDCFAVAGAGEVVSDGSKLVGSAQVRRGAVALQHGTVRLWGGASDIGPFLRSDHTSSIRRDPEYTALDRLAGRGVTFTEAACALAAGFAQRFGARLVGSMLTAVEVARADALAIERIGRCV
jgi:lipoate-protein ligase A